MGEDALLSLAAGGIVALYFFIGAIRGLLEEKECFNKGFYASLWISGGLGLWFFIMAGGQILAFLIFAPVFFMISNVIMFFIYHFRFRESMNFSYFEGNTLAIYFSKLDPYWLTREQEILYRKARISFGWGITSFCLLWAIGFGSAVLFGTPGEPLIQL